MIEVSLEKGSASEIFERLRGGWDDLFSNSSLGPFLSWGWMNSWFENFGDGFAPMVFTARRDGELIGILAMVRSSKSILGVKVERLVMMGSGFGGADYLDVIARDEDKADCTTAFIRFVRGISDVHLIELSDLAEDSETCSLIRKEVRAHGTRLTELEAAICPQIDLSAGWENVLDQSKRKTNFQRRLKSMQRNLGSEFRSVTASSEIEGAFERFNELHSKRWAASGGSELNGHPRLESFHRQAVAALAIAGLIRFDELWIDGRCCASIYGLDDGRTFYYYNAGYDPALKHLSVGLVLLGLSIRAAVERGNSTYDLLRGDEGYKFDWATGSRKLTTFRLSRRTLVADTVGRVDAMAAQIRLAARAVLPERFAEPLANWRRGVRRKQQLSHQ